MLFFVFKFAIKSPVKYYTCVKEQFDEKSKTKAMKVIASAKLQLKTNLAIMNKTNHVTNIFLDTTS